MAQQKGNAPNTATLLLLGTLLTGLIAFALYAALDVVRMANQPNAAVIVESGSEDEYAGTVVDPPLAIADFTLTDQQGQPFTFSSLRGQVVLLFFGFTHCPDFCPTTLYDFTRVKAALGPEASRVAFVFISVDGSRDTPEVLTSFMARFDSSFIALTGPEADVQAIGDAVGLTVVRTAVDSALEYTITHTVATFLIDEEGQLVRRFSFGTAYATLAEQVRALLG
ncbi:MAG: SCO family protein [Chloroflexi bacterium]|nr:SCO family protein [Chloroflexota bacterium]